MKVSHVRLKSDPQRTLHHEGGSGFSLTTQPDHTSTHNPQSRTASVRRKPYLKSEGAARALNTFRAESQLDWVTFSPSWTTAPGERTGKFRVGGDLLLRDAQGESRISREDFAVAIVDEIETAKHHQQRITVGY